MSKRSSWESKMADELENEGDHEMDYRRLKDNHLKAGFVEGVRAGEESTLQQGFNEGFAKSFTFASEFSKLSGAISAVLSFLQSKYSNKKQDYSELIKKIIKLKAEVKALEQQALVECENKISQQDDQGTKSENGNHRNCVTNVDSSSSVGKTDVCLSKKKETCCQSENCCGKDSGAQLASNGKNTCSEDNCCKNSDETFGETIKEGQGSKTTKSDDNVRSFYNEMERIENHFRILVERELSITLGSIHKAE